MQEVSLRQVVDYAVAIEEESYRFYRRAMRVTSNEELQKLAENLATLELNQANRFRTALGTKSVKAAELDLVIRLDDALMPELVVSNLVRKDELDKDILRDALDREGSLLKLFQVLGGMTDINATIVALCQEFAGEEADHLGQLNAALEKLA